MIYATDRYQALSAALKEEMERRHWKRQADLVRASGLSAPIIASILNAKPMDRRPSTYQAVSLAVGKEPDWAEKMLASAEVKLGHISPEVVAEVEAIRTSLARLQDEIVALTSRLLQLVREAEPPASVTPLRPRGGRRGSNH